MAVEQLLRTGSEHLPSHDMRLVLHSLSRLTEGTLSHHNAHPHAHSSRNPENSLQIRNKLI
jgi:hypothetical protein